MRATTQVPGTATRSAGAGPAAPRRATMRAAVFVAPGRIELQERPVPGLGDLSIVTTLCPGGKERMRRLMAIVASGRVDLAPLVTHHFPLDRIEDAYALFSHQRDGVLKVAITP